MLIRTYCAMFQWRMSNRKSFKAFTLVELLTVIAIIGVLVAFLIPILQALKIHQYESQTKAEMAQLKTAIEGYKAAFGFYPPDNPGNPLLNQLYYELVGTINTSSAPQTFQTLDGSQKLTTADLNTAFGLGVSAFINCSRPGAGENAAAGKNFIHELKPGQTGTYSGVTLLTSSVNGPDANYTPLVGSSLNPWRYIAQGKNNPGSYDLWIQLSISGKKYLICNWSKEVQINNPLP